MTSVTSLPSDGGAARQAPHDLLPLLPAEGDRPERISCHDPATLEPLGEVPVCSPAEVRERVSRARAAQKAWARSSFRERRRVLRTLLDLILSRKDEICRMAALDSGKTLLDAAMGELLPVCEKIRYLLAHGERDLRPEPRSSGILIHKKAWVEWQPLGVIGVLCPWNFPFHNVFCPVVPALFAGNAVIAKTSEWTSYSASFFQALFDEALRSCGQPVDLVQIICGAGETGAALVTSGVDKVFFTGSPDNGRKVMAAAAQTLTPVVLELGGKDPMIICDDADLDQAVASAMVGVFTACGQMCVAAERIYVFDAVYDEFVRRVVAQVSALRQGPPLRGEYDVGALTMPRQLDIVQQLVDDAVRKGARVLCGGMRRDDLGGQYFAPTVLVDVDHSMEVVRRETFGPVMVILRVHSDEEAIRLANDTAYGLGSSVFTRNRQRAARYARELSAGMTVINDYGVAYLASALPFGGVRLSGFGRINGREGLRACCNEKAVVTDRLPIHPVFSMYPARPATRQLILDATDLIYSSGLRARARAASSLVRTLLHLARGRQMPS
ncbi:MAG: aldehyde dehydrogenase family protein [Myxococcales bacterium]|nr:aldehyde dehydrogenase family protein [Myxococcota bacterium]MDW8281309.1 aldehyde dehydrogenase family protein [Myxococcales bacterium]